MAARIEFVSETGSTNADLVARIAAGEEVPEGYWLVADRQIGGKGRQGRRWLDGPGNFMGSTVVRLAAQQPPASSLSFVAALAAYEALAVRLAYPRALRLKWPNDILLDGAKLSGILLERERNTVVVGIGVNLAAAPAVPDRQVETLARIGPAPDRDMFARDLASHFESELRRWREFGPAPLLARWLAAAHPVGTRMTVHDEKGERITGEFDGVEPDGALRLRLPGGAARVIHAGDVMLESE